MKKLCITFIIIAIIVLSGVCLFNLDAPTHTEYLRIHVRANSNADIDQAVKYQVKDAVVNYLTPYIANCDTKEKAQDMLTDNLSAIESVCDGVLKKNGFAYKSRASVKNEQFPTRVYDNLTLDGGFYDALIIELGDGKGDNWWCVVYPPLCFTGEGQGYVYKSKIKEIISDFFKKEKV
ncbi:MAG: stage II sporulation protein R [Clostridia bacterium]|nr:stage II sporulation protein R [Clostridia bacterium]